MMLRLLIWLAFFVTGTASATDYRLYYFGGQSNMDGFGYVDELPARFGRPSAKVVIFTGNQGEDGKPEDGRGLWAPLQPGYGTGFTSDGETNQLSDRFGAEVTFGHRMLEIDSDARIAILKYSRGGTGLAEGSSGYGTWAPDYDGVNQYDHALAAMRNALSVTDVDGDGEPDRLIPTGIIWMQGEADAYASQAFADAYEANLKRLMDLIRAALRVDDLPVVIGRITDSGRGENGLVMPYIETVQAAQARFVESDACAAYVTEIDDYDYPEDDDWHYDSNGYVRIGIAFANAAVELEKRCGVSEQ